MSIAHRHSLNLYQLVLVVNEGNFFLQEFNVNTINTFADKFFSFKVMVTTGILLGVLAAIFGWWNFIEPATGVATLAIAATTWWQTRRARQAVYADNGDGSWVVALQVGRPILEAVKKEFGQCDVLVDVKEVLGENTLSLPEHYEKLAREVYKALCAGQSKNIHLIISGPVALNFLVGQMVGLFHFQVTVYQYDPASSSYKPMPRPTRDWLEHRE